MLEKGRLYSLRKDGTKDSLYLNIKKKRFMFGSSEYCTVRIYIDGIFPEHCVLTIGGQGKAYLKPLHPSALTLVNGIKIKHKVCLEDNDVVTIFVKEFQFAYPPNSLSINVSFERLILPYPKQMEPTQNPSCSDKSLIQCMNQYVKESSEERRNLALKLYEFINFLRALLNRNEEYLYNLWPILESIWKHCIARAREDILFLPLKFLNIKGEITVHKKSLQSRILSCTSENLSPVSDTISERVNYINSVEVGVSSNCKIEGQKQNHYSSRVSISYKKRVSLAVKRYHLRKRKSIMLAKAAEIGSVKNLELSGETPQMKDKCREINSDEQDAVLNMEKQQTTRRKRRYNKKEKEELQDKEDLKIKQEINIEVFKEPIGKLNTISEQAKEKRRNKKTSSKKTDLKPGKENIEELIDNSSGNQVTISNLREQKLSKERKNSKNKVVIGLTQEPEKESIEYSAGEQSTNAKLTETKATKQSYKRPKKEAVTNKTGKSTLECDTQELSRCQRITRSMAKRHH